MKVAIFGVSGNLGSGIFDAFKKSTSLEILAPTRLELNLLNSKEVISFFQNKSPDIVIQSAGITANKNSTKKESINSYNSNIMINNNIQNAAIQSGVLSYIDISSASIYQNFSNLLVSENDFHRIAEFYPSYLYSKSKAKQSLSILEKVSTGHRWYSVVIPYVISTNNLPGIVRSGLFNRISSEIINAHRVGDTYRPSASLDTMILRQFVHGYDVGRFCFEIINNNLKPGILHLPNLPYTNLENYINLHLSKLNSTEFKKTNFSLNYLGPKIVSIQDEIYNFNYEFTLDKIVNKLLNQN
jgi:nucleoside-diphosphate-sugar epimerase